MGGTPWKWVLFPLLPHFRGESETQEVSRLVRDLRPDCIFNFNFLPTSRTYGWQHLSLLMLAGFNDKFNHKFI